MSSNGSRVVIGAQLNDATGSNAGKVRVFEFNSSTWVQIGNDLSGKAANDRFGYSVSLSSDGGRVAIGAYLNDGGGTDAGHVRVFEYISSTWVQLGAEVDGEAAGDVSGYVSLSWDGNRMAIGARSNSAGGTDAGHVRIFDYDFLSSSWVQMGVDINGDVVSGFSGQALSMSGD